MRLVFFLASAWLITQPSGADELRLVVQPEYAPERAQEVYKPLIDYLNRATSHSFVLITPRNFHLYWAQMREENNWDLVVDDAHFTSYRVLRSGYEPLVKASEDSSFTLLADWAVAEEGLDALVAKRVVSLPSPSLGFVLLQQLYNNPLRQPIIVSSALGWRDAVESVFAQEADGAMVPTWLAQRYPNLGPVAQTEPLATTILSAAPTVNVTIRDEITAAFLRLDEEPELHEVLLELNVASFVPANRAEFANQHQLLESVFGY